MTCFEKWRKEHTGSMDAPPDCPHHYGYLDVPDRCGKIGYTCTKCWSREIPEEPKDKTYTIPEGVRSDKPHILDSGSKTEFTTGAVRDSREGKGRCDLLPLDVVADLTDMSALDYIAHFVESGEDRHLYRILEMAANDGIFSDVPTMFLETSKQYAEGAEKYGENNWKNGMPVKIYIDSAVRHYLKFLRGDNDEPHDRAFCWNIMCAIWTCKHKPELNDYAQHDISDAVKEMMD